MRTAIESGLKSGATHIAFGGLFLEDIRAYRIKQLEGSGLDPLFPIWHEPTEPLARRMIAAASFRLTPNPQPLTPSDGPFLAPFRRRIILVAVPSP